MKKLILQITDTTKHQDLAFADCFHACQSCRKTWHDSELNMSCSSCGSTEVKIEVLDLEEAA